VITGAQVRAARALLAGFLLPIALSGVGHREAFSRAGKAATMKVLSAYLAEQAAKTTPRQLSVDDGWHHHPDIALLLALWPSSIGCRRY
jgi:hypothetical protein